MIYPRNAPHAPVRILADGNLLLGLGTAMVYPSLIAVSEPRTRPGERVRSAFIASGATLANHRALSAGIVADIYGMAWAISVIAALTFASGTASPCSCANRRPALLIERKAVCREVHNGQAHKAQSRDPKFPRRKLDGLNIPAPENLHEYRPSAPQQGRHIARQVLFAETQGRLKVQCRPIRKSMGP